MVTWHHQLKGYEFEQALGDSDRQETWHAAEVGHNSVTQQQSRIKEKTNLKQEEIAF